MKKSKLVINFSSPILLYYESQNARHWHLTFTALRAISAEDKLMI